MPTVLLPPFPDDDTTVELLVIVPTRGRPDRAADLIAVCHATCTADTALLLAVDDNDPLFDYYYTVAVDTGTALVVDRGPHGHVHAINTAAQAALGWDNRPYALAKLDDDHRPQTVGWDVAYLDVLRELGTGIVYGNDLLRGEDLPTAPALTADIVATLGYMAPPELGHLYCDDFWRDLGRRAGCIRYLPDVIVEHMHPAAGKAEWDDGYWRVNSPTRISADAAAYGTYASGQMFVDVNKVRALRAQVEV